MNTKNGGGPLARGTTADKTKSSHQEAGQAENTASSRSARHIIAGERPARWVSDDIDVRTGTHQLIAGLAAGREIPTVGTPLWWEAPTGTGSCGASSLLVVAGQRKGAA